MAYSERTVAPLAPLISLNDAKAWLRVDSTAEDALIEALTRSATEYLDGNRGILGAALVSQTWALRLPSFPSGNISLPVPPVQSVTSITYFDSDNASATVAASGYRLVTQADEAAIELTEGASWPATYPRGDAVTITYVSGYGEPLDVPAPIRTAAFLMVAQWYENRMSSADKVFSELPFGVRALLMNYRQARGLM